MKKVSGIAISAILFLGCLTVESSRSYNQPNPLSAAISAAATPASVVSATAISAAVISSDTISNVIYYSPTDSVSINDLVYHDYGTGVKLTRNSTLTISLQDLTLKEETAEIYVIELTGKKAVKLCDYPLMQDISYTPEVEGVYQIIAVTGTGVHVDLTPKAGIKTTYTGKNSGGLIPLQ